MDREKVLKVRPVPWSAEAEAVLACAVPHAEISDIKAQGGAVLFEVEAGGERVGFYVLRVDTMPSGSEGVLVAACGSLGGSDLTESLLPHIEGQFRGCGSIRIHTARPGLARKLARKGYSAGELVLRKTL